MQIGPYLVERELARGGQGVVYLARDPRVGRAVVVKLLQAESPAQARRLLREARAMAQLRHPHVVGLHDLGEHEGRPFLVMPYVPGESLQDRLDRDGPLPLRTALRFTTELARALTEVHALGLVHRDVKPANVLVDERGHALLTDFGLVKHTGPAQAETLSLSVRGALLGTPGYWPPEQAFGQLERIGPASDVYALGALAYALLSGRPPRDASNLQTALEAFAHRPPALRGLRAEVPRWVARLLDACLQPEVAARPSLSATLEALEQERYGPERRGLALAAGGAGLLLLGLGLASTLGAREAPPPTASSAAPEASSVPPTAAPPEESEPASAEAELYARLEALELALKASRLTPEARDRLTREQFRVISALGERVLGEVLEREPTAAELEALRTLVDAVEGGAVVGEGQLLRYVGQQLEDASDARSRELRAVALIRAYELGESEALVQLGQTWPFAEEPPTWRRRALLFGSLQRAAAAHNATAIAVLSYDLLRHARREGRALLPCEHAWLEELLAELRRDDPSWVLLNRSKRLRLSCALGVTALHRPGVPREELEAVFAELRRVADDLSEEPDEAELLALAGDLVSEFWNRLR